MMIKVKNQMKSSKIINQVRKKHIKKMMMSLKMMPVLWNNIENYPTEY